MTACGSRLRGSALVSFAFVTFLAVMYMGISSGLITFNKYLMHQDRFPFALGIGMNHMICSFTFNMVFLQVCPAMYPSLADPEDKVEIDSGLIFRILMPIAMCFAAQIVLSNMAFMHSSVTMLQMMKQSNVVFVYVFSLALSLETFCKKRAATLALIFCATVLTIHGDLAFNVTGFTLQGTSMLCESLKLTLQSHSLSATGRRLDPFTYVTLVAPLVLGVLILWLVGLSCFWSTRPKALTFPPLQSLFEYRWILIANGCLAFAMQVAHAAFMKNSSAITFILAGVVMKDVLIVAVCSIALKEELSPQQIAGFTLQLTGVLLWSLLKSAPTSSPPPLPRGATGLIAAYPPSLEAFRNVAMQGASLKGEDHRAGAFPWLIPRNLTNGSESTSAPLDDSFDEETVELREAEGI